MSSDIAIKVENLGKCYQIYSAPQDRLKQSIYPRLQKLCGRVPQSYFREFWALHDVSFEIKRGEVVGIIGRNGSGKSTLLQMICGTLTPSRGVIQTNGRVAALLELGAGFNPEFTGYDNIYLNASILGMSKHEVDARLNDIIDFADIGDFIRQPVKTYSSGMLVRLAFAVASHVDAEILIVDEALAVGDAFFTQKCMIHIKKLMESGVTLLFVSHDSNAVKSICNRAILLEHGVLIKQGDTNSVVEAYYSSFISKQQGYKVEKSTVQISSGPLDNSLFQKRATFQRIQNGKADFINVQLLNEHGVDIQEVEFGQRVILRMFFCANIALTSIGLAYHIRDKNGFDLIYSDTNVEQVPIININQGEQYVVDWQFNVRLNQGDYTVAAMLSIPIDLNIGHVDVCDFVPIAIQLKVNRAALPIYGSVHWENKVSCQLIQSLNIY